MEPNTSDMHTGTNVKDENKCDCWCHTHHYGGRFKIMVIRRLFVVLALLFVFWLGLRLGELRTFERLQRSSAAPVNLYYGR